MEYCDGVMLTEKLKDGPLKQDEVLNIAVEVAEGLNAAHKADITHRDIKSQNIIVSEDCPTKIIDFGIAKQQGMTDITRDGTTLGTQCYMSPEQLHGSKVDKRSDIFSFGVVLYEMATGKLPFTGKHDAEILYSVVNEEPIPITTLNPNMDNELQRIISKAMQKNVKDRYQHIDDMLADLRNLKKKRPKKQKGKQSWWRVPTYGAGLLLIGYLLYTFVLKKDVHLIDHTLGKKSIAVLPFTTIDRTEESEIFGEGIHDDILTQIAKIHDLKVIARTSVIKYKDTDKGIKEIAKELDVSSILEGSVRRAGDKIRIVAQLIDPETEEHLWAETYDKEYADIFSIQSEVAQKIASALETTLSQNEFREIEYLPTDNLEAYEYYVQAKILNSKYFNRDNFLNAMPLLEKAIELDSNFTLAHALMCNVQINIGRSYAYYPSEEFVNKAKAALDKAIILDATHPDVLISKGYYTFFGLQHFSKALEIFNLVLHNRPNDSELFRVIGQVQRRIGDWDSALSSFIIASEINPQSYRYLNNVSFCAWMMRNWALADNYADRKILMDPSNWRGYEDKIMNRIGQGKINEAQKIIDEAPIHFSPQDIVWEQAQLKYYERKFTEAYNIRKNYIKGDDQSQMEDYFLKGLYLDLAGKNDLASTYYDSLITLCYITQKSEPDRPFSYQYLARAFARKGLKEKALNVVDYVNNLANMEQDILVGTIWKYYLMEIYISLGEYELGMNLVDYLLSVPSWMTIDILKIEPKFDQIRNLPRYKEILSKYENTKG
jgi:TolB-like protein